MYHIYIHIYDTTSQKFGIINIIYSLMLTKAVFTTITIGAQILIAILLLINVENSCAT